MTEERKVESEASIHDWLAIGDIDRALSGDQRNLKEEINRLPLFLRLLSAAQPLAAIPVLFPAKDQSQQSTSQTDPLLNSVVFKLEDVAATYSEAEGIDVLTSHYAPVLSRRLSKLPPLKRKRGEWITIGLTETCEIPKKRRHSQEDHYNTASESENEIHKTMGAEIEETFVEPAQEVALTSKRKLATFLTNKVGKSRRKSDEIMLQEDSYESQVSKTLEELIVLVVDALKVPILDDEGNLVPLRLKADSILADADASGTSSTLAALMYHLPVLRHDHVANALCRANVPQATAFLLRMGQNCPTAVSALIRGCINAAKESPITVKASLRSLAGLSKREANRVRSALQQSNLFIDVQLEIALDHDAVVAASILIRELEELNLHANTTRQHVASVRFDSAKANNASSPGRRPSNEDGRNFSGSIKLGTAKTLGAALKENLALTRKAYDRMIEEVQTGGIGRRIIFLRAITWLLYRVGGAADLTGVSSALKSLGKDHEYFSLLLSASLILCSHSLGVDENIESTRKMSQQLFFGLLTETEISTTSKVFISKLATLLIAKDTAALHSLVFQAMQASDSNCVATNHDVATALSTFCTWTDSNMDLFTLVKHGLTEEIILEDSTALVCALTHQTISTGETRIKSIFQCPDKCHRLLAHPRINELIREVAAVTTKNGALPIVLPIQLEAISRKINFFPSHLDPIHAQFLLQIAYSLCIAENNLGSPFIVDPRDIPAVETLRLCSTVSELSGIRGLECLIRNSCSKICPEVLVDIGLSVTSSLTNVRRQTVSRRKMICLVTESIRKSTNGTSLDPSGRDAETQFVNAKRILASNDVDVVAAEALLATTNSPALYLTYSMLCRDPLVLLRCPVLVWKKQGLRRIVLIILQRLLKANDQLIAQASRTEEVAKELSASRDSVVLRCLLVLTNGNEGEMKALRCSYITSVIRSIISKRIGMLAALAKQGHLSDSAFDFLVDFVPESMNDAGALTLLLSELSPLTAAERLKIADVALRVAIAHGSRCELEAKILANAALTQLTSSFFLVVGPVGVPVNVLIEESGYDVTHVCRCAAFRMLEALQKVRGDRIGLKEECANALQKLAGMCKGENIMNGLGRSAAQSRKKVLKQIWESITKACNSMATGVHI